ncbi:hypothetical protein [Nonomuraea sp. SYSU D8015]|uniref:hypothetical protein n=1 Tax=Nonomuraea sp. SYSU D8015 TaxID=2593644 RepID=UPI0016610704|nr:hypothetical protein [Nonomuraea sp. SYSU D8015]
MTTTVTPDQRGSRRRRFVGLSAAAAGVAAAATAAVVVLNGVAGAPAYAVTKSTDGSVSVQINAFTDPEGLEAELADAGVKAVVDYLPEGQICKSPRGQQGSASGKFSTSLTKEANGISFKIEEGQVPAGETLVLAVSKSKDGDDKAPFAMSLEIVKGAVADCEVTAVPQPPADGRGGDGAPESGLDSKTDGEDTGPSLNQQTQ